MNIIKTKVKVPCPVIYTAKIKTKYKTEDGRLWDKKRDAIKHEEKIKEKERVKKKYKIQQIDLENNERSTVAIYIIAINENTSTELKSYDPRLEQALRMFSLHLGWNLVEFDYEGCIVNSLDSKLKSLQSDIDLLKKIKNTP